MAGRPLPLADDFNEFSLLCLNSTGRFVRLKDDKEDFLDGTEVTPDQLPVYLKERVVLPSDVTDVFVWVHGWRNTHEDALTSARRLFAGIRSVFNAQPTMYPKVRSFVPAFLLVRWPSMSSPLPGDYVRIRDRATGLTEQGDAEFFLASLLGYLEQKNRRVGGAGSKTLASSSGFFIHCIGHSFGGRFLVSAICAAGNPQARTLSLLKHLQGSSRKTLSAPSSNGFEFTVDSALIFQMAAPNTAYGVKLSEMIRKSPFRGPLILTHSEHDTANCYWHIKTEGEPAIGCYGAAQPATMLSGIALHSVDRPYDDSCFSSAIINVNANHVFSASGLAAGAHSDIWYEESIHLLLSLVSHARFN